VTVGEKIKSLREGKGWTMRDLAEQAGLSEASVCRWEMGDRVPKVESLLRLSKALEVGVEELMRP
jgi:transcriptional regulator with XRE-family HTH domain